jgi:hypothetical protein
MKKSVLLDKGSFHIGCNYWASHAGIRMWEDWRPEIIEQDFKQLSKSGMQLLRVFPLWPVFQPLTIARIPWKGDDQELRFGDMPLGQTPAGKAGVSTEAMEKFRIFANLAEKHNLKLVVALVTGWMSGRLFVPPAFESSNVITDATALKWQKRFVSYFVETFKDHKAIDSWGLGNECNCMGNGITRDQAWLWTNTIASAIRQADPDRAVLSDMHSIQCENGNWRISDQAELTDILTTHPYPQFTPKCGQDQLNTIRNGLHATAESRLYGDVGNRPCIPEELGTLGPVICNEKNAAAYLRTTMFSSWAHDCRGLLWWCAYDQDHLDFPPYEWVGLERELGLIRNDRKVKPVCDAMQEFGKALKKLPFKNLPEFRKNAVCVLTRGQDQWSIAFSSFILAKQAGFDIEFQYTDQPLKKSDFYIVPSIAGSFSLYRSEWLALLDRAKAGATVLMTYDNAFIQPFEDVFGLEVESREKSLHPESFKLGEKTLTCTHTEVVLRLKCTSAKTLLVDLKDNPLLTCNKYGKGKMLFLNAPLERYLSDTPGVFNRTDVKPYWKLYGMAAEIAGVSRIIASGNPQVGVTEHFISKTEAIAVLINYNPAPAEIDTVIGRGWKLTEVILGKCSGRKMNIEGNDAAVVRLIKNA